MNSRAETQVYPDLKTSPLPCEAIAAQRDRAKEIHGIDLYFRSAWCPSETAGAGEDSLSKRGWSTALHSCGLCSKTRQAGKPTDQTGAPATSLRVFRYHQENVTIFLQQGKPPTCRKAYLCLSEEQFFVLSFIPPKKVQRN